MNHYRKLLKKVGAALLCSLILGSISGCTTTEVAVSEGAAIGIGLPLLFLAAAVTHPPM